MGDRASSEFISEERLREGGEREQGREREAERERRRVGGSSFPSQWAGLSLSVFLEEKWGSPLLPPEVSFPMGLGQEG